ncbi:Rna recognition motif-containing protein, partial [Cardiosporidium cionae]
MTTFENYSMDIAGEVPRLPEAAGEFESELDEIKKLVVMTEGAETHEGVPATTLGMEGVGSDAKMDMSSEEVDQRSVYVGNVEYSTTPLELQEHFRSCGHINRITIMVDKWTGHPKGFAYIEFQSEDGMRNSLLLSNTMFKDRVIKVTAKRTNIPGFSRGRELPFRGRPPFSRGGGGFRGG